MIKFNLLNKNRGFTMVETLVAVAILMISIAGPLTIAQKGLNAAIYARDQVIASFLAQDAMEFLKNYRDYNVNSGNSGAGWLNGIYSSSLCYSINNKCAVDTTPGVASPVTFNASTPSSRLLYLDSAGGYKTSGSNPTQFSRYYYIVMGQDSKEATIVVSVEWANGTIRNAVTLENQIFNIIR